MSASISIDVINQGHNREEFSDNLEQYLATATNEIMEGMDSEAWLQLGVDLSVMHKRISEILIENIYIPLMMGEDKHA